MEIYQYVFDTHEEIRGTQICPNVETLLSPSKNLIMVSCKKWSRYCLWPNNFSLATGNDKHVSLAFLHYLLCPRITR